MNADLKALEDAAAVAWDRAEDAADALEVAEAKLREEEAKAAADRAAAKAQEAGEGESEATGEGEATSKDEDAEPPTSRVLAAHAAVRKARRNRDRAQQVAARATDHLEEARTAPDEAPPPPEEEETPPEEPPPLMYANVDEFVVNLLLPNWRRPRREYAWCEKWWAHAEAITRLESLWESWEWARVQPVPAMAVWWRDFATTTMNTLCDQAAGPFARCKEPHGHEVLDLWPSQKPPPIFRDANEEVW